MATIILNGQSGSDCTQPVLRNPAKPAPSKSGSTEKVCCSYIKVAVRVRPFNDKELQANTRLTIDVVDENRLVFDPKEKISPFFFHGVQQSNKNFVKRANKQIKFAFDRVFDQSATNQDVFESTTKEMLSCLMEGYNCSVFAYGATGAGKTYTMIGDKENPGITYLTMDYLFFVIDSFEKERQFEIAVSYIEIYNENVYDLLKPSKNALQLREDSYNGVVVAGLSIHRIKTARELLNMLESGNKNRTQHPTDANAESSRSHAVFQVYVKMSYQTSTKVRVAKLSMIDLAGSERASATGCKGDRFKEGANINKSLLSLGNCINSLADGSSYIPYRDSKLTRLLKDCLGGNCKTIMIANVSPSSLSYEDTYNTLKYAARANEIQLSLKKNIVNVEIKASQYVKMVEILKKKVLELETKLELKQPSLTEAGKEPDLNKEKESLEWRQSVCDSSSAHDRLEAALLELMSRQRVLTLRRRLQARAAEHVEDLAHRSSTEAIQMKYDEEIPRQERAADSYSKQFILLESKIHENWTIWKESRSKLHDVCNKALSKCPNLQDLIDKLHTQRENIYLNAIKNLNQKLLCILDEEFQRLEEYTRGMPSLLRDLYLTLKGYDKVPPGMTEQYIEVMKNSKCAKAVSWSDSEDSQLKMLTNLDLENPMSIPVFEAKKQDSDSDSVIMDGTDIDLKSIENQESVRLVKKRKGTPIKMPHNDVILIDDSLEQFDTTHILNSAKKPKREFEPGVENNYVNVINPNDLNSTFVLTENMLGDMKKLPLKTDKVKAVPSRPLADGTNTINRNFRPNDKAMIMKPVGKTTNMNRGLSANPAYPSRPVYNAQPARPATSVVPARPGFGSSLTRDGKSLTKTLQAVRGRERMMTHPYSRLVASMQRK